MRSQLATVIIESMALHELHPFISSEIKKLPRKGGVYFLFQIETPIHADGAVNLRRALLHAKSEFPQASHFAAEVLDTGAAATNQRRGAQRAERHLVKGVGFVGSGDSP